MSTQQSNIIKFKSTNTSHQILELQYDQNKTVLQYKQQIGELLEFEVWNIKFVYKGKVLGDKEKAGGLNLKGTTVMMVLTKPKQQKEKPSLPSSAQTIPKSNLSTGLGSSSPVGFGNYGLVNHPQYMSAISSAVDPQKMSQMLDDPYYQSMIQQMMDDPETLKQLMEQNPMTKQMMDQNPMMKMIMSNPAMMKMVFNKQTIKMAQQMQKNGTISPQTLQQQNLNGNPMMQNMLGGMSQGTAQNNVNPNNMFSNGMNMPFGGGNPLFPMMGSGFGMNPQSQQGMNFPANNNPMQMGGMFNNPFLMQQSMFNSNPSQPQQNTQQSNPSQSNGFPSLFQNLQSVMQKANQQGQYSTQLKQLSSMGFDNKQKNIKYLKQSQGDIDKALQKLCLDDDQEQQKNKTKNQENSN